MSVSEILVTGGTGSLGRRVVDRLRSAGRDVRVLSRSGRSGTVRADLLTGEGLDGVVEGIDASGRLDGRECRTLSSSR